MMKLSNPLIRRLEKEQVRTNNPATLGGIVAKVFFFLLLVLLGGIIVNKNLLPEYEQYLLLGAALIVVIVPIVGIFAKRLAFLLGSIYSIAQGIVITSVSMSYANKYEGIIPIALGITVLIFLLTLTLYATGIVKVGEKFKSIVKQVFIGSILLSGIVFISSMFTDVLINIFYGNGIISIGVSILMVIIATISLIMDFDTIVMTVREGKDKRLEWFAAFGFIMSLLWLYLRVLELAAKIMSSSEKN